MKNMSYNNPEDLNYDCNYNMFLAKNLLGNLKSTKERKLAVKWMRKLSTCTNSVSEMRLRNDFMYFLVVNIQNFRLDPPFNMEPPPNQLLQIRHLLPLDSSPNNEGVKMKLQKEDNQSKEDENLPFLYSHSPDGGAFLAAQPVPRCGAFCYLAVVSHSKD